MSKKVKYFIIVLSILVSIYFIGFFLRKYRAKQICTFGGGRYLSSYHECELNYMMTSDKNFNLSLLCVLIGGKFDSCESSCRHDSSPRSICIQVCEPVCKF